jgi:hypothetical protein
VNRKPALGGKPTRLSPGHLPLADQPAAYLTVNGSGVTSVKAAPAIRLSAGGALIDLLAVGGAIILAAGLSRRSLRDLTRRLHESRFHAAIRSLHDGGIGDSATWATVGTTAIALIFAIGLR